MDVGLVERPSVDEDDLVADLHPLSGQADDALDEVASGIFRELEDHHVPARDRLLGQNPVLPGPERGRVDHLVDQQVIADQQVVLHRAGRDLEGLDHERADEEREDDGDDHGLEVLADDRLLVRGDLD
jgi:hypothetical protein